MTRDDPTPDDGGIERRTYLKIAASAAATAGLAGCSGMLSDDDRRPAEGQVAYGYGGNPVLLEEPVRTERPPRRLADGPGSQSAIGAGVVSMAALAESEPNDAMASATAVQTNADVTGSLAAAEVDWFSFDATGGESFDVVFNRTSTAGVTAVLIYGPEGESLDLRYAGTDAVRLTETAVATAPHYVEVVDVQQGDGDYTIRIETGEQSTTTTTTTTSEPTTTTTSEPTSTSTTTSDPTTTTTIEDDYGDQGYGQLGYGGTS